MLLITDVSFNSMYRFVAKYLIYVVFILSSKCYILRLCCFCLSMVD